MPVQVSYPGVYIEELPSGVRTITGVATSITAFVGRAQQGLVNEPIAIFSFGDYERMFGGLNRNFPISYAVQDFFTNGGSQAIIVRLYRPTDDQTTGVAALPMGVPVAGGTPAEGPFTLDAASPGKWGNNLFATIDTDGIDPEVAGLYAQHGIEQPDLFNLTIYYAPPSGRIATERHLNVSVLKGAGPRRLDRVLAQQSGLVRMSDTFVVADRTDTWDAFVDGWQTFMNTNRALRVDQLIALLTRSAGGVESLPLDEETYTGSENEKTGIYSLANADLFNILCIPPDSLDPSDTEALNVPANVWTKAVAYCVKRRAMLVCDSPTLWSDQFRQGKITDINPGDLGIAGEDARNAAVYFPRVVKADPMLNGHLGVFPPCGIVAGIMSRTDVRRGVWKAPAGQDASLNGISGLEVKMTDAENGVLNPIGINCLRSFPITGMVVWGARTLRGADQFGDDYKYIPVRRLTLYIEESLYRGTQWAVFEPNAEPLWAQLRLNINTFMADLSRQGAFYSYYVKCDKSTTTQSDIDRGIVNIVVAFAPVKPAEFVVLQIQQLAGQTAS